VDELPPGTQKFLTIDARPNAVFNIKGEIIRCPPGTAGNSISAPASPTATPSGLDLGPESVAKRTSAQPSEFMRSRLGGALGCDKITRRAKFRLTGLANHFYKFARLTRQEGRIAIVTKRGMGCGGRGGIVRAMGWQGGFCDP
jgi:hypothetical protein